MGTTSDQEGMDAEPAGGPDLVTCIWCDEHTPVGAPCQACGGDPAPFGRPSGMVAARQRQVAARKALLTRSTALPDADQGSVAMDDGPPTVEVGDVALEPEAAVSPGPPMPGTLPVEPPAAFALPPRRLPAGGVALAVGIPLVALALIGFGLTMLGSKSPSSIPVAAHAPLIPATSSTLGPSSGRAWVAFTGPNFAAEFPASPLSVADTVACACGASLDVRAWQSVDGLARYYVIEIAPLPAGASADPNDVITGMLSVILQESDISVSTAPVSTLGPYESRDVTITGQNFGASARILVGNATIWALVGRDEFGQPPDWQYFLKSFTPGNGPVTTPPSGTPATGFE